MQLSGRPLLDNSADQALFVGRDDALARIERSLRSGLNCLVVGQPGSGKSSLVRAMMFRSHAAGDLLRYTYVRANEARTAADLLAAVLAATRPRDEPGLSDTAHHRTPVQLLDELRREIGDAQESESGSTRIMVVEDVTAAAGSEVFGALRDELWQIDVRWLVTTSTAQLSGLLRPPADVFFETRVELGSLAAEEAVELARRRLGPPGQPGADLPAELVTVLTDSARETPRRLLDLLRELVATPAVGGQRFNAIAGLEARAAAIGDLSRPARMLAQELEALGWSSASDERLLARMGWTRTRVIQVMAELEDRGLVDMREENTGRGRPRKLYRLKPPAEFGEPAPATPASHDPQSDPDSRDQGST